MSGTSSVSGFANPIPARAGIGLKPVHYSDILERRPGLGWFEVHPENYMGTGGPPHAWLAAIRDLYPVSFHGVGLNLGGSDPLDEGHLQRLADLIDRYEPALVSEHLAWASHGGTFFNDLLPLPLTQRTLDHVACRVEQTQDFLSRQILIENPSTYLQMRDSTMAEPDFLVALARRTGCGLLLDINNAYVSASNHGWSATDYIDAIPGDLVGEVHLAGHAVEEIEDDVLRIDDHAAPVCEAVWRLYRRFIGRVGAKPTLIERDGNIPALPVLCAEAAQADRILAALNDEGPLMGRAHG